MQRNKVIFAISSMILIVSEVYAESDLPHSSILAEEV